MWLSALALAALIGFFWTNNDEKKAQEIPFNPDFMQLVEMGFVKDVHIEHGGDVSVVRGQLSVPERTSLPEGGAPLPVAALDELYRAYPAGEHNFRVNVGNANGVEAALLTKGVAVVHDRQNNTLMLFLVNLVPTLLLIGVFWYVFFRQTKGGPMGFGRSRVRLAHEGGKKDRTTFKDVAGCEEAKEEVVEVVEYLKDPKKFGRLGGKMPHGILMAGPPGTGKTLLAKAIAGEADVPFFSSSGSDFVEMFVGVGASRVRDLFVLAKKNSPCLLFIDEIDAVGRRRGAGIGGGHDEREQTLNQLLVQMDGFDTNAGIVVIAATNRPDVLDPALLRPGRFDRQVVVDLPTMEGRLEILKVHVAKIKVAEGTDLSRIARGTPGCSGADLANIVNEAALIAARREKPGVDEEDFEAARDKVLWGKERRSHALDDEEKRLTAYHEAGHAVCAIVETAADPVHKVTIIPRGHALGLTAFLPKKDKLHYTRRNILADLVVAMGGRAAEEVFLDDISTGARQDLKQATELAHAYVCDWGLSDKLGPRTFGKNEELVFLGAEVNRTQDYSEETARLIDDEVSRLLRDAHDEARAILESRRERVELLVKELLEKETVDGPVAESIVRDGRLPLPPPPPDPPPPPPAG
ncbi:MAG: ATP-dependent zinc metalloprotease FtsH [Kiritimatiellae bacterium]|nr:ATP-dependent zinc metalloprotease FtsH [Kiritimatiellia bacterium]